MNSESLASHPLISIYSNPPKIQNFSIPENIIFYISKNPTTSKVYNKLIYLCKYFYLQNQIITVNNLWFSHPIKYLKTEQLNGINYSNRISRRAINSHKLWINGWLRIKNINNFNLASTIASKIYKCDIISLILSDQFLTFDEFKLFASIGNKILELDFWKVIIKNKDDGSLVPIEKLFEILPNLEIFKFGDFSTFDIQNGKGGEKIGSITSETAKNLIVIPHFSNIKKFVIKNVPQIFEIETFLNGLKKPNKIYIYFRFDDDISEAYKNRLQKIVNDIVAEGLTENYPPNISFSGSKDITQKALWQIMDAYEKK